MCQAVILNMKGNTMISYCSTCQCHYIWQQSFLLTFSLHGFRCFANEVEQASTHREYVRFPDGALRTFLQTPTYEILLTFTKTEWQDFALAVQEAEYMREVYGIINNDIKS